MVHLPLEEVTLLERVKIKADYLNPAEKMFFGIGETLPLLIRATLTVMNLAMVAKAEMAMAQVAEGGPWTRRNRRGRQSGRSPRTNRGLPRGRRDDAQGALQGRLRACQGRVSTLESMGKFPPKDG
jgi:hypothetical protein